MKARCQLHIEVGLHRFEQAQQERGGCLRLVEREGLQDRRGVAAGTDRLDIGPPTEEQITRVQAFLEMLA